MNEDQYIDDFLDALVEAVMACDLSTFSETSIDFALYDPLIAEPWVRSYVLPMIDEVKKREMASRAVASHLHTPSTMRTLMFFDLFMTTVGRFDRDVYRRIFDFYSSALHAFVLEDPFAKEKRNMVHAPMVIESMIRRLKPGTPEVARSLGRLANACYNLAFAVYSDMNPEMVYESYGPYYQHDGKLFVIKKFHNLKPVELWSEASALPVHDIEIGVLYENVTLELDFISHAVYQGDQINGLRGWWCTMDGRSVGVEKIDEVRRAIEEMAIAIHLRWRGFDLEHKKELYWHQKAWSYKKLRERLNMDWRPSEEVVAAGRGKQPAPAIDFPEDREQMRRLLRDIFDPRKGADNKKRWYRHGTYRDNILFSSLQIVFLGPEWFAQEWLPRGMGSYVRINDEAYIDQNEFKSISDLMGHKLRDDPDYLDRYIAAYRKDNEAMLAVSAQIGGKNFKMLTNEELAAPFERFIETAKPLFHWLWSMEFLNSAFDTYIRERIRAWKPSWAENEIADFLNAISYLKKPLLFEEEIESVMALDTDDASSVRSLWQRYAWLNLNTWDGRPFDVEAYTARVNSILARRTDIERDMNAKKEDIAHAKRLFDEIDDKNVRQLVANMLELIRLKTERIDVFSHAWFLVLDLVDEIAVRLGVSYEMLLRMSAPEISDALRESKGVGIDLEVRATYALARIDHEIGYHYGEEVKKIKAIVTSQNALEKKQNRSSQIKGLAAYKGKVTGRAKVLLTDRELDKLERGDILVSNLTNPNYNPAFEKVAGVVTDEGGVLCHSAIMAREFRLPCIVGTKVATQVIKDGDTIEVDADRGVVRILP